jgi:3-hydroxyacyl-CoA dehydrogenase
MERTGRIWQGADMSITSGGYDQPKVAYRRLGSIAELSLAAPSHNLLVPGLRAALLAALDQALQDPDITGIVLCAAGGQFSHGGDLAEAGHEVTPTAAELCSRLESAPKCVVALIDGNAFGAGLELALAAHYRLAGRDASLAMPAIAAGQVPAGGATQRLPRLIGVVQTLEMLLRATPVSAMRAAECGLVDAVLGGSRKQRLAQAHRVAAQLPPRPTMARPLPEPATAGLRALGAARAAVDPNDGPAAACIIDCIEAAQLLPADQGLGFENANAVTLAARPETEALKYAYRAALRAAALPAAIRAAAGPLPDQIAVWGAGPEALSLVSQALARRIRVTLVEPRREVLLAGIERIAAAEEAEYLAGRLSMAERDARWSCLTATLAPEALSMQAAVYLSGDAPAPPAGIGAVSLSCLAHARQAGGGIALCPALAAGQTAELALAADYSVALAGSARICCGTGAAARLADRADRCGGFRGGLRGGLCGGLCGGRQQRHLERHLGWRLSASDPGCGDRRCRTGRSGCSNHRHGRGMGAWHSPASPTGPDRPGGAEYRAPMSFGPGQCRCADD